MIGLAVFTRRVAPVRRRAEPGGPDRRALRAGRRRRADLGRDPRDDRDDVPRAAGAGQGDRRLQLRRLGGRVDRPARRRRAHPGDQLALDLLRQPPDRRRHRARSRCGSSTASRASACARRRRARRRARHRRADARASTRSCRRASTASARLARSASARSRWRCSAASSRARRAPRTPLVPLRIFRSRNVTGANLVQILMVAGLFGMFFLGALYLQGVLGYDAIETGLAFLPVSVGIGVLSLGFSAKLMERFGERATLLPGLGADRRRPAALLARAGRRELRRRRPALDAPARRRRRRLRSRR